MANKAVVLDDTRLMQLWNAGLSMSAIAREMDTGVGVVKSNLKRCGVTSGFSKSEAMQRKYDAEADVMWPTLKTELDAGTSPRQAALAHGLTVDRISRLMDRHGYDPAAMEDARREEYRAKLSSMRGDGMTVREMATALGLTESTLARHLGQLGLTEPADRTDISDSAVVADYEAGMTITEIAEKHACSHDTVTKRLARNGIVCDRATGIRRHFEASHEKLWPIIKSDLDNGAAVSVVASMHHLRTDNVVRLMDRHRYVRPVGRRLDEPELVGREEALSGRTDRKANTERRYLSAIRGYCAEHGHLPSIRLLSDYMGVAFSMASQAVQNYDLARFIDATPSCGWVLMVEGLLSELGVSYETNNRRILRSEAGTPMEMDIWVPDWNLGIEINPTGTHTVDDPEYGIPIQYHQKKSLAAEAAGVGLLHMYDDDFLDGRKLEVFRTQMRCRASGRTVVGARECSVRPVSVQAAGAFLDAYHFQGRDPGAGTRFGLYYGDELVAVLCMGRSRFTGHDYEIIRYCPHPGYAVSGGFARLLSAFVGTVPAGSSIVSYMDMNKRFSAANVYERSGFTPAGITRPDYWWAKKYGTPVLQRYETTKSKLVGQGYDPALTEVEIMRDRGYYRVFGAGSRRYVFTT